MTETTVGPDLLQALEVITELGVDTVGKDLPVLAVDNVALPVEEPLLPDSQPCVPLRTVTENKRTVGIL